MKRFFSFLVLLFFSSITSGQTPQIINYQGVARNASGAPYAAQQISVRVSIHTGMANGTVEYSETRTVQTNPFGLFNLQIGSAGATNVQGSFAAINWSSGAKFLQTEISKDGEPYVNIGTTEMSSVPFSILSNQTKHLVLPFDTTVHMTNSDVFTIRNQGAGVSSTISAESLNGNAINGYSTNRNGVLGRTEGKKMTGVSGFAMADSANGVTGTVHFTFKDGVGVLGDGGLNNNGVRGKSFYRAGVQGFSDANYGVYGESKSFPAVAGSSNSSAGVTGQSVSGIGVTGLSESGAGAIYGSSGQYTTTNQFALMGEAFGNATGVLAKSNSQTATALVVDGKMKIFNNGSFPGAGKVLTSDAAGNATWQAPLSIAFRASSLRNDANQSFASGTPKKVLFYQQARYNIGEAYDAENSIFFVPVAGIYHFYAQVDWFAANPHTVMTIRLLRAGTVSTIAETHWGSYSSTNVISTPSVTTDIALQPNDAIWIEITQSNDSGSSRSLEALGYSAWFTGHLMTRL